MLTLHKTLSAPSAVLRFYLNGFRSMTLGKTLWKIILIKLFIIFAVFKLFFFQDFLGQLYETDQQKANHVMETLILKDNNNFKGETTF